VLASGDKKCAIYLYEKSLQETVKDNLFFADAQKKFLESKARAESLSYRYKLLWIGLRDTPLEFNYPGHPSTIPQRKECVNNDIRATNGTTILT
jgi:hypothetical protein